eukprot:TRINITY_DN2781_c1_g1_i1.p2 TRINITY_DN2781_c1_g1~~TRINITY_DN2781_c1_g1_i1.p2  ORF type:complete len:245 (+),score=-14.56 TRINITY_DN2781_c1_g1_i1:838-1572(+)
MGQTKVLFQYIPTTKIRKLFRKLKTQRSPGQRCPRCALIKSLTPWNCFSQSMKLVKGFIVQHCKAMHAQKLSDSNAYNYVSPTSPISWSVKKQLIYTKDNHQKEQGKYSIEFITHQRHTHKRINAAMLQIYQKRIKRGQLRRNNGSLIEFRKKKFICRQSVKLFHPASQSFNSKTQRKDNALCRLQPTNFQKTISNKNRHLIDMKYQAKYQKSKRDELPIALKMKQTIMISNEITSYSSFQEAN